MQIGEIVGHATATVKHPSMKGWKLSIVQIWDLQGKPDGEPFLAIDSLGAGIGQKVIVCNDGAGRCQEFTDSLVRDGNM